MCLNFFYPYTSIFDDFPMHLKTGGYNGARPRKWFLQILSLLATLFVIGWYTLNALLLHLRNTVGIRRGADPRGSGSAISMRIRIQDLQENVCYFMNLNDMFLVLVNK